MQLNRSIHSVALCAILSLGLAPPAQAGPLIDWLFGRRNTAPAYPVGQPVPMGTPYAAGYGAYAPTSVYGGYAANYGTYYGSQLPVIGPYGAGYGQQYPSGIVAATQPGTMSLVPNFRSSLNRAPVTYYRPLLTTDPNTGAQVVAMAPCTSYEYQTQRVPAWGNTALYGNYAPPTYAPPPSALPTYTLPSGGIPLATTAPSLGNPTLRSYGGYNVLQPSTGNYPNPAAAAPSATTPYAGQPYSATGQGACGVYGINPSTSIPGLSAPPGPTSTLPYGTIPQSSSGVYPDSGYPPTYSDPADTRPALRPVLPPTSYVPPSGASLSDYRSTLRSIQRVPREDRGTDAQQSTESFRDIPSMSPIPAPEEFDAKRQWTPPLLREGDMTAALQPVLPGALEYAGQSKPIHWASFESSLPVADDRSSGSSGIRPIQSLQHSVLREPIREYQPAPAASAVGTSRYDTSGWKASR